MSHEQPPAAKRGQLIIYEPVDPKTCGSRAARGALFFLLHVANEAKRGDI